MKALALIWIARRFCAASIALSAIAVRLSKAACGVNAPRKAPIAPQTIVEAAMAAAGYKTVPLEQRVAAPPVMPLPSPAVIDRARGLCEKHELKICRGSKKGCDGRDDQDACRDCYIVPWHDTRSGAEIIEAIERGDG